MIGSSGMKYLTFWYQILKIKFKNESWYNIYIDQAYLELLHISKKESFAEITNDS